MATIVGSFFHSHGGTTSLPPEQWVERRNARPIREDVPNEPLEVNVEKARRTHDGFRVLREKIAELETDALVVFSDDSDFISLYVAIRDERGVIGCYDEAPFLWVVTDREGSLSATIRQFFPLDQLHVVSAVSGSAGSGKAAADAKPTRSGEPGNPPKPAAADCTEIADRIIEEMPIGTFKSMDCQPIIKKHWPQHPMAKADGPSFGSGFLNNIWPILQKRGAKKSKPGRYEMTAEAKSASL